MLAPVAALYSTLLAVTLVAIGTVFWQFARG
jgi:hypothetical protein